MNRTQYSSLTAVAMAQLVRDREVSPVELVRAALDAIGATEARLNAWCDVLADLALAQAAQRESEAQRGTLRGPLHGVPIGVKDLFSTAAAPARRARPNGSFSSQAPRIAANITEVSRSAATAAIGARVMAHSAIA